LSRSGLFDQLSDAELSQKALGTSAYVGTDGTDYVELTFTTPTHGLSTTVILADGAVAGSVNGSDISAAIKGINDALEAAGISTISASEDSDGKLVITGTETYTVAETLQGAYAATGLAASYNGVAKTYDYNGLADYNEGDVVTGMREDGSQESFLVTATLGVTGNGRTFDEFAALSSTQRLNNNLNPNAKVFRQRDGAGTAIQYEQGTVVYDDSNGRYYLTRGASGNYSDPSTSAANASVKKEFLELGTSLPGLSDYNEFDANTDYSLDDIVSYDGNLYVASSSITNGQASPLDGGSWVKFNVAVSGTQSLLDMDNDLSDFSVADLRGFIQIGATSRAQNGAEMSRLEVSNEMLATNHANIEAANSTLADVDVATESTAFARANILVQSAAAMLAQANTSQSVALSLLQ
jgi:flagellin